MYFDALEVRLQWLALYLYLNFCLYINLLEYPIPAATAATCHKNRHMALHVAAAWYHRSAGVKTTGKKSPDLKRALKRPLDF